jgi:hypothetical protein
MRRIEGYDYEEHLRGRRSRVGTYTDRKPAKEASYSMLEENVVRGKNGDDEEDKLRKRGFTRVVQHVVWLRRCRNSSSDLIKVATGPGYSWQRSGMNR